MPTDVDIEEFLRLTTSEGATPPVLASRGLALDEDAGAALLRSIMSWLKKESGTAETFGKKVEGALPAFKGRDGEAEMAQMLDVMNHLTDLLDTARDVAQEVLDSTSFHEGKKASDPLSSLSRWLIGATAAVGSYVKKIGRGSVDGKKLRSKEEQEALTLVIAALGGLQGNIDQLRSQLPILLNALTK